MTIKEKIKEHALEIALLGLMVGVPLTVTSIRAGIDRNYYSSLSKEEQIKYLENELNTTYNQPRVGFRPSILAMWTLGKADTKEKLQRLKGSDYTE